MKLLSRLKTHKRLLLVAIVLLCGGVFLDLTFDFYEGDLTVLDNAILQMAYAYRMDWLNGSAIDMTALGSTAVMAVIVCFGMMIFWLMRDFLSLVQLAFSAIGSAFMTFIFKNIISRPRPNVIPRLVEVSGFSYPSGHTLVSTAVFFTMAFILFNYFQKYFHRVLILGFLSILSGLIGLSRIYLGVHYPSDVLSAYLLGVGWALLLEIVLMKKKRKEMLEP